MKGAGQLVLLIIWWATMIASGVLYGLGACALLLIASCCISLHWLEEEEDEPDNIRPDGK